MSLKRRLIVSNVSMMLIPIAVTVIAGLIFAYVAYILGINVIQVKNFEGHILIFAPIGKEMENSGVFLIFLAATYSVSFLITNIIYSVKLSKSLATPLLKLKTAVGEISRGNLNYAIIEDGDEEIREVSRALDQMRFKLEESINTQIKSDDNRKLLVSSISHDLKTPITSIKGYVEGILDKVADTPEKRVKYLKTIYQKAVQVDSMIDDLLLYSKLDLNQIPFNFENIDIIKYFQDCLEEIGADMERDGIEIFFEKRIPDGTFVSIDRIQIKRVLLNLLENAVKYKSPDRVGQIKITLRQAADFVIIEIKDNGIGIPKDNLPFIFDRFYRADAARTKAEGSGLGLAIAKQITQGHGGKIWVRSIENEGTEFMISIKIIKPAS